MYDGYYSNLLIRKLAEYLDDDLDLEYIEVPENREKAFQMAVKESMDFIQKASEHYKEIMELIQSPDYIDFVDDALPYERATLENFVLAVSVLSQSILYFHRVKPWKALNILEFEGLIDLE